MPDKFLEELASIGATAGIALGLDRLFLLFMGRTHIAEVMPFISEEL